MITVGLVMIYHHIKILHYYRLYYPSSAFHHHDIYFITGNLYVFFSLTIWLPPFWQIPVCSLLSMPLILFCRLCSLFFFFPFQIPHISKKKHAICLFLSDLFHLSWYPLGLHGFINSKISLLFYGWVVFPCTSTSSLFILLLKGTNVVFMSSLLGIMLQWT